MSDTCLLDLPDELLIRCLAGAGGLGIGSAAAACTRLEALSSRLKQLPIFSSALSTLPSLQLAIKDAGQRALAGCFGVVDFALLFVANYGNTRGKKYPDPTDVGHAVEMLRDVLGQDVVTVGCACAGLMGVGPDSQPIEVDPSANMSHGRAAAAARKKAGLPPLPTKGVSVLLGKLPPGCVARAFAQKDMVGPSDAEDDISPEFLTWDFLDDALALSSSQAAALAHHLNAAAPPPPAAAAATAAPSTTTVPAGSNHQAGNGGEEGDGEGLAGLQLAGDAAGWAAGGADPSDPSASPGTAAAAEGLLSVVAAAAAAADAAPAQQGGGGGVQLVPHLCLLLYDEELQSFGYTASTEMERALTYLANRGVAVVGGASSGAGDLFFSPGADAGGRSPADAAEPSTGHKLVGLMLCTAKGPSAPPPAAAAAAAAADPLSSTAAAAAAAAAGAPHVGQPLGSAAAGVVDSSSSLQVAALASLGLGAAEHAPLFSDLRATLVSSQSLSVNHIAVQLEVQGCSCTVTDAAAASGTQAAAADTAAADAAETGTDTAQLDGTSAESDSAAAAAAGPAAASDTTPPEAPTVRRSARLAAVTPPAAAPGPDAAAGPSAAAGANAATAPKGAAGNSVEVTPIHHLFAAVTAGAPTAMFDDDEADDGQYLALWLVPQGAQPTHFTGEEEQVALVELLACDLDQSPIPGGSSSSSIDSVKISAAVHTSDYPSLRNVFLKPPAGSRMCCQVVKNGGAACARTLKNSLSRLLPLVDSTAAAASSAAPASAAVARADAGTSGAQSAGRAMQECYDALAQSAYESGARSGLQALAAMCCTGRGRELYAPEAEDDPMWQENREASIIDAVGCGRVPFVGAYVAGELGPEVRHMCTGWFKPRQGVLSVAEMQGFTTMLAAWGCPPGVA